MPFSNYTELKTAVADWLARDDLTSQIVDFIRLAEIRVQQDLEMNYTREVAVGNLVAAQSYLALPSGFVDPIQLTIKTTPVRRIQVVSPYELEAVRAHDTSGIPKAGYARGTAFELGPVPGDTHEYELLYWAGVTALSDAAPTNWLLTNCPNLLLYGALIEAALYMDDEGSATRWATAYDRARMEVRRHQWRARSGGGPLRVRPDFVA